MVWPSQEGFFRVREQLKSPGVEGQTDKGRETGRGVTLASRKHKKRCLREECRADMEEGRVQRLGASRRGAKETVPKEPFLTWPLLRPPPTPRGSMGNPGARTTYMTLWYVHKLGKVP